MTVHAVLLTCRYKGRSSNTQLVQCLYKAPDGQPVPVALFFTSRCVGVLADPAAIRAQGSRLTVVRLCSVDGDRVPVNPPGWAHQLVWAYSSDHMLCCVPYVEHEGCTWWLLPLVIRSRVADGCIRLAPGVHFVSTNCCHAGLWQLARSCSGATVQLVMADHHPTLPWQS